MDTLTISSVQELTGATMSIFRGTQTRWWFRGQKDQCWDLLPKVRRGYTRQEERYLTNLFYTRAPTRHASCPTEDDYGGWLALMQHFGLPTRLLDWSSSALIAAYFAVKYSLDIGATGELTDAAIWLLEPHRLNESQGYEPVFPPLNANSLKDLVRPAMKGQDSSQIKVLAASPVEGDLRMFAQQGQFTVHVTDEPLNHLKGCDSWLKKITVPSDAIPRIADELDVLGMRLADIFPDLQNLAMEITNMFPPAR